MHFEEDLITTELIIDSKASIYLKEVALWGKFISVLGYLYSAVIAIGGVAAIIKIVKLSSGLVGISGILKVSIAGVLYLMGVIIVFSISLHLFKFSKKIQAAIINNNQEQLTASFLNLKIYFRFAGILTVILLFFTVLAVIGILLAVNKR
jgi:hypothetical protein